MGGTMTPDHDPDPAIPTAPRHSYPATVDLGSLLQWGMANIPRKWEVEIATCSTAVVCSLLNPFGDRVKVHEAEGLNPAGGYISHVNYARRACGLTEAVYLEPGDATK